MLSTGLHFASEIHRSQILFAFATLSSLLAMRP
jgi:hypothetical protein